MKSDRVLYKLVCFTVYPEEAPSVRHRIAEFRPYFLQEGLQLEVVSFLTSGLYRIRRRFGWSYALHKAFLFAWCTLRLLAKLPKAAAADIVVIHREVFPLGPPWFELAIIRLSKRSLYDLDDAIWCPPSNAVNQRAAFWCEDRVPSILRKVDAAIAGSPYVKDYMRQYNHNVSEAPTTCDDIQAPITYSESGNRPVVVWIGNWGNAVYVGNILWAIEQAAEKVPFALRLIGGPDIYDIKSECVEIQYCDWSPEHESEWLTSADIGIMPLIDSKYEQGKCAFKLIQYMSAGLALIASPVGMNRGIVTPDIGYLAATDEDWIKCLICLMADKSLRESMAQSGRARYRDKYSRASLAGQFIKILQGETEYSA